GGFRRDQLDVQRVASPTAEQQVVAARAQPDRQPRPASAVDVPGARLPVDIDQAVAGGFQNSDLRLADIYRHKGIAAAQGLVLQDAVLAGRNALPGLHRAVGKADRVARFRSRPGYQDDGPLDGIGMDGGASALLDAGENQALWRRDVRRKRLGGAGQRNTEKEGEAGDHP